MEKEVPEGEMNLTKKEFLKISDEFGLGTVKNYKLIKGGLVNHNYLLETKKDKYIVRIIRDNNPEKIKHLKLQFRIFDYLKKKDFPYLLPYPLRTKDSKEIVNVGGKSIWVYVAIDGQNYDRPNIPQIKLMAKALAIYHKSILGFKGEKQKEDSDKRIVKDFKEMQKIVVHNPVDKLALKYRDYFKEIFNSIKNVKFTEKQLFVHSDFDSSNVLFKNGKLIGIIDFDDTSYFPRVFDIAISIRDSCYNKLNGIDINKLKIFLKEYEKVSKLSKEEKKRIIPIILKANVDFFVWIYVHMKKEKGNKKRYMQEMIDSTENILKNKEKIVRELLS